MCAEKANTNSHTFTALNFYSLQCKSEGKKEGETCKESGVRES